MKIIWILLSVLGIFIGSFILLIESIAYCFSTLPGGCDIQPMFYVGLAILIISIIAPILQIVIKKKK